MLLGQKGGRAQHRHLLAVHHGDKSRAQRHFGLAEAHVAADEPVHRAARVHVVHDGGDGRGLIGGFFKGKAFAECLIVGLVDAVGHPLLGLAQGVQVQQFGGRVAHLLGGLAAGLFPVAPTEAV